MRGTSRLEQENKRRYVRSYSKKNKGITLKELASEESLILGLMITASLHAGDKEDLVKSRCWKNANVWPGLEELDKTSGIGYSHLL